MSGKKEFTRFLVSVLAPFALIAIGAGMVGLGFTQEWNALIVPGLVVAGAGVVWGLILLLLNGPLDWFN